MKPAAPVALLLLTFVSGCSHTYYVAPGKTSSRGDTLTISLLNKRLAERSALVATTSAGEHSCSDVVVSADSCTFLDEARQQRSALPVTELQFIRTTNHFAGALGGLGVGLAGSSVLFATTGALISALKPDLGTAWIVGLVVLTGAAVGTVVATVTGAVHGARNEYVFHRVAQRDSVTVRTQADSLITPHGR